MSNVETMANQAVFHLQLNTRDAVRFIQRNTGTDETTARRAIRTVATFYKK
jgi:hypothetical protein